MSSELQVDYVTGKSVYFLVRNTTGSIWNGSSFVAYNASNYGDYDVVASEQGSSGYYVANMPGAGAGVYEVVAKERVGGSPAESDLTVGTGEIQWTGSAVLPLSSLAALAFSTANMQALADIILTRDVDNVEGSSPIHTLCTAILKLVSRYDITTGGTANIYRTDGSTVHASQTKVTDASLVPVRQLGVAG